ncbi:hypothetical protein SKAU_G00215760 [Synaphobranchus kaupii]|uniref:Uncharacterized protein n=1 Tax=Synaphobranchus kaupii TaxID=118154 RepID=A0A9Q1F9P1_SYNKA|nr:hypothetical protein SKAU_G00215760 [Synaphobranchus kaupii]
MDHLALWWKCSPHTPGVGPLTARRHRGNHPVILQGQRVTGPDHNRRGHHSAGDGELASLMMHLLRGDARRRGTDQLWSLSSFYYPDRQQRLSAERLVVSPAGVMMRLKLCFGQLKGQLPPCTLVSWNQKQLTSIPLRFSVAYPSTAENRHSRHPIKELVSRPICSAFSEGDISGDLLTPAERGKLVQ